MNSLLVPRVFERVMGKIAFWYERCGQAPLARLFPVPLPMTLNSHSEALNSNRGMPIWVFELKFFVIGIYERKIVTSIICGKHGC